jgi:hypothetical protein
MSNQNPMRASQLGVRLLDSERKLLEAAAQKEQVTQSELARRGLLKESRLVLNPGSNERAEP